MELHRAPRESSHGGLGVVGCVYLLVEENQLRIVERFAFALEACAAD